jgi:cytochrome c oxidase subunit I
MTEAAQTTPSTVRTTVGRVRVPGASGAARRRSSDWAGPRRELVGWAWLAVGALAVAGVFALLLALSRVPGMENAPFWPLGFFYKGLVIHVVFSLVIWLMGIFAFLVSVATLKLAGDDVRAAPLGLIGQGAVLLAFPCLFAPAFLDATQPELANYVPLIRHPAYELGLLALALGVLAPVVRLMVNLPARLASAPPLALALALAGFVYLLALACFAIAGALLVREGELASSRDELFWGGGHLMQFVYAALMLTNWSILARLSLGEKAVDSGVFLLSVLLVALIAVPAPAFYAAFAPFSDNQREAFRLLQFGIAAPTLIFAGSLVSRARTLGPPSAWPWRDPAFFALATSLALFALGGVMGFVINGSDTRTPAHYHAVITAVSVSSAGMLLTFGLKELGRLPAPARATRVLIGLYGGGQFVASIGMFVAGGYGAARKTPTGVGSLDAVAAAGMAVHGVASIFTILGGAAFVVIAMRALLRPDPLRST